MSIVVVGSLNLDRFMTVERLPRPGETVTARESFVRFGGKGANQAVAAARLGARVALVGALGEDAAGDDYLRRLQREGIDVRGIARKGGGMETGSAAIAVEASGENQIIVHPGANGAVTVDDVRAQRAMFASARVVVLQNEVPLPAVLEAMRLAQETGALVVFNPSPWRADFPWDAVALHTVIVNEHEVRAWLGEPRFPSGWRIERVVVTQGGDPTLGLTPGGTIAVRPPSIQPVDTVGAGDAFAGAYAVALAEGQPFAQALAFANAAGALTTQQPGAQEAIPLRSAVNAAMKAPPSA